MRWVIMNHNRYPSLVDEDERILSDWIQESMMGIAR